jgi:hypothetical protein
MANGQLPPLNNPLRSAQNAGDNISNIDPIQLLEQLLAQLLSSPPNVQAPPNQVQDPLRRPERGLGGPRNTESAPSAMGPQGQRGTTRRTRGMLDHSKQLSDIR